jgi:chromodomain-helicase-DNA-binding protein 7
MCKRQAGEKLLEEEKGLEGIIDDIGEDHAKLILDRLELLSKLREIAKHPKLDDRLKLCENNLDTPDWWESGKHDKELIKAVLKYGLYRSDQYILNDSEFPFAEAEKRYIKSLEVLKSFKFDNPAELFKFAMGDVSTSKPIEKAKAEVKPEVSQEKVEKIETETEPEVSEKPKENAEEATVEQSEEKPATPESESVAPKSPEKVIETEVANKSEKEDAEEKEIPVEEKVEEEAKEEETPVEKMEVEENVEKESEIEEKIESKNDEVKMEVDESAEKPKEPQIEESVEKEEISAAEIEKPEPIVEESKEEIEEKPKSPEVVEAAVEETEVKKDIEPVEIKKEPGFERPEGEPKIIDTVVIDDDDTLPEKPEESVKKDTADLKTNFPDLEAFQPLMKLKQLDAMLLKGDVKDNLKALSRVFDTSMIVKWFREFALEKRISHIIYCVEKGNWPVGKSYSAYSGCMGINLDLPLYETVKRLNADKRSSSSTPDIITITTDHHQRQNYASQMQSPLQSISEMTAKGKKAQKRHIAIDVETERAKLHALLNNTVPLTGSQKSTWNEDEQELRRSSTSSSSSSNPSLQPPPAHQHVTRSSMSQYKPTVTIPGTSSTLTPIDLSSR